MKSIKTFSRYLPALLVVGVLFVYSPKVPAQSASCIAQCAAIRTTCRDSASTTLGFCYDESDTSWDGCYNDAADNWGYCMDDISPFEEDDFAMMMEDDCWDQRGDDEFWCNLNGFVDYQYCENQYEDEYDRCNDEVYENCLLACPD